MDDLTFCVFFSLIVVSKIKFEGDDYLWGSVFMPDGLAMGTVGGERVFHNAESCLKFIKRETVLDQGLSHICVCLSAS